MTPATTWKESIPPGEAERFERYAEELRAMQRTRAVNGTTPRALHSKGVVGAEATFEVLPDLPAHCRQGLFAKPGTYKAYVRYSNGSPHHQADAKPDVRGMAVKIVGVDGKKIIPGMEDARTQDFLANRNAALPFSTADQFVGLVRAGTSPVKLLPFLIRQFGLFGTFAKLPTLAKSVSAPAPSLAGVRYFSGAAIAFGPYAVRFDFNPQLGAPTGATPTDLRSELAARLNHAEVTYDLRLQFFRDEKLTPIEDFAVEWQESNAPFVTVARITIPQQDLSSPRAHKIAAFIEGLSFDPWHALAEFRPLGNIMRARNHAYRLSTIERKASPEPDGSETFD
jgi:hypothetical protein